MPPIEKAPKSFYATLQDPFDETSGLFDRLYNGEFESALDVTYTRVDDGHQTHMYVFQYEGDDAITALDSVDGRPINIDEHYVVGRKPNRIARVLDWVFRYGKK